jgi:hypothetical protein
MLIAPTREEFRAAQSLQTHCDLDRIALLRCCGSRVPAGAQPSEPYTLNASHSTTAKLIDDVLSIEASFNSAAVDAKKAQIFAVECTYELCYKLKEGYKPQENEIEAFKDGNAVFNCWPYFREFLQDITARMGQAPPPLPFLRVVPKPAVSGEPEANPAKIETGTAPAAGVPPGVVHRRRKKSLDP